MDILTNVISVFITSIVELWIGIPLGLFLDLNPLIVAITAAAGSILSAFIVIVLGDNLRKWFIKWHYGEKSIQDGRIYDIWNKYGIIGLGLLSPLAFWITSRCCSGYWARCSEGPFVYMDVLWELLFGVVF